MAAVGDYFKTHGATAASRVKAYSAPPLPPASGRYLTTLSPDTVIGPLELVLDTGEFVSVLVKGYWMNLAKSTSDGHEAWFARRVPDHTVQRWRRNGWRD